MAGGTPAATTRATAPARHAARRRPRTRPSRGRSARLGSSPPSASCSALASRHEHARLVATVGGHLGRRVAAHVRGDGVEAGVGQRRRAAAASPRRESGKPCRHSASGPVPGLEVGEGRGRWRDACQYGCQLRSWRATVANGAGHASTRSPAAEKHVTFPDAASTPMTTLEQSAKGTSSGGELPLNVSFHGVRGSTPCSCESNRRYGGNTACVALDIPGSEPIVLDLGTGLRFFGETQPHDGTFRAPRAGDPPPLGPRAGPAVLRADQPRGAQLDIYGPPQEGLTLAEAFEEFMRPPYFPVRIGDLVGDIRFHTDRRHRLRGRRRQGPRPVRAARRRRPSATASSSAGISVAYISDHQQPLDGAVGCARGARAGRRRRPVDPRRAVHAPTSSRLKAHWGHCTVDYALHVAREAGARRLALFHHDPSHSDDDIDRLLDGARRAGADLGLTEVIAASEGSPCPFGAVGAAAR